MFGQHQAQAGKPLLCNLQAGSLGRLCQQGTQYGTPIGAASLLGSHQLKGIVI